MTYQATNAGDNYIEIVIIETLIKIIYIKNFFNISYFVLLSFFTILFVNKNICV